MHNPALRYPRGFVSAPMAFPSVADYRASTDVDYDEEVVSLYHLYMTKQIVPESWTYRSRVIDAATRLFGDFRQWCHNQAAYNDHIYELNFDYLVDTLNFIRNGERAVSALTLRELLLEKPAARHGVATPARADALRLNDVKEFENYIGKWVSHEKGFEDLLLTLYVFFGPSKKSL